MYYRHKRILRIVACVFVVGFCLSLLLWYCLSKSREQEDHIVNELIEDVSDADTVGIRHENDNMFDDKTSGRRAFDKKEHFEDENGQSFLTKYGLNSTHVRYKLIDDSMANGNIGKEYLSDEGKSNDVKDDFAQKEMHKIDSAIYRIDDEESLNDTLGKRNPKGCDNSDIVDENRPPNGNIGDDCIPPASDKKKGRSCQHPSQQVPSMTNDDENTNPTVSPVVEDPDGVILNPSKSPIGGEEKNGVIWIIILIVLFIFYITARVMVGGRGVVIWISLFDKFIVFAAAVLFFVSCLFDEPPCQASSEIVITLRSISGVLILWSVILSIIGNLPSLLNVILSILAKAFVFYCICFFLVLALVVILVSFMVRVLRRNNNY